MTSNPVYAPTRALRSSTSKLLQVSCTNLRFGSCSFRMSAPIRSGTRCVTAFASVNLLTTIRKKTLNFFLFSSGILRRPLATHYPSASDSVLDFWRFINFLTYLLTLIEPNYWYRTCPSLAVGRRRARARERETAE